MATSFVPDSLGSCMNINTMGIGKLGDSKTVLMRKFRFLMSIDVCGGKTIPPHFVRTAARPDVTIEDYELNFLNEKTWIPGKAAWEQITFTYYGATGSDSAILLSWLASVYDFTSETRFMNSAPADYAGTVSILMLNGCGDPLEHWKLGNAWPTSIKFGELDYSSSDTADIELTLRYSNVEFSSCCGGQPQRCPCTITC